MVKHHLSKNGEPQPCTAKLRDCPLGNADQHYSTKEEARLAYEGENSHRLISGAQKGSVPYESEALKELIKNSAPGEKRSMGEINDHLLSLVDKEVSAYSQNVVTAITKECVRQHVGVERAKTLIEAYNTFGRDIASGRSINVDYVEKLTGIVEPDNHGRFRTHPITFRDGGTAAHHSNIRSALDSLFTHGNALTADEFTKEYLWIHPSSDGNGRTGWLLYNWKRRTLENPEALPKYF